MATTKIYITAGLPPKDNSGDDGSTLIYITAGLTPDDTGAPPVGRPLPQRVLSGPFAGPLGGPI